MRDALGSLTHRGRLLVIGGITSLVGAWLFGQRDLLRVGLLLIALPALSALLVGRSRYRLSCARGLSPVRLPVGRPATAVVRLENVSRLPSGVLMVQDELPAVLGRPPRFVLDRMESGGTREVTYPITSDMRGRWVVGPVAVRLVDPFGLCSTVRSFSATDTLVVTPVVHQLGSLQVGGSWTGAGESRSMSIANSGEDDVVPREHRTGDDLRRVHWRATARAGELMVRREEQPWRSRATVLLDLRAKAHAGDGADSSLEFAVSFAASVAAHLLRRGFAVRVVDGDGNEIVSDVSDGDAEGMLLDTLAVVAATSGSTVAAHASALRRRLGDGLLVAVLGTLDLSEAEQVARLRQGGATGLAVVLDTAGWPGGPAVPAAAGSATAAAAASLLAGGGWRTTVTSAGQAVSEVWASLGRGLQAAARVPTAGTAGPVPGVPTVVNSGPAVRA